MLDSGGVPAGMVLRVRQTEKDLHRSPRTKWELAWFLVMKWPLGDLNLYHGLSSLSPESNQALDFFFLIFIYLCGCVGSSLHEGSSFAVHNSPLMAHGLSNGDARAPEYRLSCSVARGILVP